MPHRLEQRAAPLEPERLPIGSELPSVQPAQPADSVGLVEPNQPTNQQNSERLTVAVARPPVVL
eukprot:gene15486-biopygen11397